MVSIFNIGLMQKKLSSIVTLSITEKRARLFLKVVNEVSRRALNNDIPYRVSPACLPADTAFKP